MTSLLNFASADTAILVTLVTLSVSMAKIIEVLVRKISPSRKKTLWILLPSSENWWRAHPGCTSLATACSITPTQRRFRSSFLALDHTEWKWLWMPLRVVSFTTLVWSASWKPPARCRS